VPPLRFAAKTADGIDVKLLPADKNGRSVMSTGTAEETPGNVPEVPVRLTGLRQATMVGTGTVRANTPSSPTYPQTTKVRPSTKKSAQHRADTVDADTDLAELEPPDTMSNRARAEAAAGSAHAMASAEQQQEGSVGADLDQAGTERLDIMSVPTYKDDEGDRSLLENGLEDDDRGVLHTDMLSVRGMRTREPGETPRVRKNARRYVANPSEAAAHVMPFSDDNVKQDAAPFAHEEADANQSQGEDVFAKSQFPRSPTMATSDTAQILAALAQIQEIVREIFSELHTSGRTVGGVPSLGHIAVGGASINEALGKRAGDVRLR